MTTAYHSQYWAHALPLRGATGTIEALSRSIAGARVDLNPHQVDAALFAIRSPLTKGVILADEVGLGKTIEAGIVIAQRWAERKRRIHAGMDKASDNTIRYTSGSLENPAMSQFIIDVLEGTRWAFRVRDKKYQLGEG